VRVDWKIWRQVPRTRSTVKKQEFVANLAVHSSVYPLKNLFEDFLCDPRLATGKNNRTSAERWLVLQWTEAAWVATPSNNKGSVFLAWRRNKKGPGCLSFEFLPSRCVFHAYRWKGSQKLANHIHAPYISLLVPSQHITWTIILAWESFLTEVTFI